MTQQKSEFWDYSLTLYSAEGVADHCLILQNDYNLDVNLILFCVWFGQSSGELPSALLDQILAFSSSWRHSIVQPLRNVRNSMKDNQELAAGVAAENYEDLRENIKVVELHAEKLQQEELQRLAESYLEEKSATGRPDASLENLKLLCEREQVLAIDTALNHLSAIVTASSNLKRS